MMTFKKFIVFFTLISLFVPCIFAALPRLLNVSGRLRDNGVLVSGDYNIIFKIYNAATLGTPLWEETHYNVSVDRGYFSVILGETNPLDLDFNEQYWLELVVNGETLSPRIKLTNASYAFASLDLNPDKNANIANTLYIDISSKRVGINTTAPATKLHIIGSDGSVATFPTLGVKDFLVIENNGNANINLVASTASDSGLKFTDSGASSWRGIINYNHSTDSLWFGTASAERLRITSTGNVGIGTSNPQAKLHVVGDVRVDNDLQINGNNIKGNPSTGSLTFWTYTDFEFKRYSGGTGGDPHIGVWDETNTYWVRIWHSGSNPQIQTNGGDFQFSNPVQASSFKDKDNTSYYLDPSSETSLVVAGDIYGNSSGGSEIRRVFIHPSYKFSDAPVIGFANDELLFANYRYTVDTNVTCFSGSINNAFDGKPDSQCYMRYSSPTYVYVEVDFGTHPKHYFYAYGLWQTWSYDGFANNLKIEVYRDTSTADGWDCDNSNGDMVWTTIYNGSASDYVTIARKYYNGICKIRYTLYLGDNTDGDDYYEGSIGELMAYHAYYNVQVAWPAVHKAGDTMYGDLRLYGSTSDLFVDGSAGIGTTTPSAKLDVAGDIHASDYIKSDTGFCIGTDCITSWPSGGSGTNFENVAVFDTPGTYSWTPPAGVTNVLVIAIGGGGGGGGGEGGDDFTGWGGTGGGGGGSGGLVMAYCPVTPGNAVTVVVGAGGTGGAGGRPAYNGTDGTAGGKSSFGTCVTAYGGAGGTGGGAGSYGSGPGGAGGTATRDPNYTLIAPTGNKGENGEGGSSTYGSGGDGGTGANSPFDWGTGGAGGNGGAGGTNCTDGSAGSNGTGYGAGGGGGGGGGAADDVCEARGGAGGNGTGGLVIIRW